VAVLIEGCECKFTGCRWSILTPAVRKHWRICVCY